ncbi:EXS family-domain-containing protein [Mycena sp. CBHHK59/15]|nr:EXS family-domain-containing protein [Mycena sp. CBHHK59/15]
MSEIPVVLAFPLPFRVLALAGIGILAWATNLHGLDLLGVDVVTPMDLRIDANPSNSHLPPHLSGGPKHPATPSVIYTAVYRLPLPDVWEHVLVDAFGYIPAVSALVVLLVLVCPIDAFCKSERDKFLHTIRRCILTSMDGPVYFADVVFADIFTSFAKVLGDVWLSACMLLPGNTLFSTPTDGPWLRWVAPTIMSFPYLIRLKQCVVEYSLPTNESRRPLFNALKYATAFPVIYLSAAQRIVVSELIKEKGDAVAKEAWHGEHRLFRLWLLAAAANSLFSFWWDVTNDWGLTLLKPNDTLRSRPPPPRPLLLPHLQSDLPRSSSHSTTNSEETMAAATKQQPYPYGLRAILLFPLPVYPLLVFLNLVLRLTWSIKLSSHLHSKPDGSVTIFWLEMAEVMRRWMWVFVRVEWEVIKRMQEHGSHHDVLLDDYSGEENDYEMVPRTPDHERLGRVP